MTTPTTPTAQTTAQAPAAENQIITERREKLAALRAAGAARVFTDMARLPALLAEHR